EPNTFKTNSYLNKNRFNKKYLDINLVFDSTTGRHNFSIPAGYDYFYIKINHPIGASGILYKNNQSLYSISTNSAKFKDFCKEDAYKYYRTALNGMGANFYVAGNMNLNIRVVAEGTKNHSEIEKFEYGMGLRIKRVAFFTSTVSENYLE